MRNDFYLPILKSKDGEFTALSRLTVSHKKWIVPLFEVTPLEWDHAERKKPKTLDEHAESFCKKIVKRWGNGDCFVDTVLLNFRNVDNTPIIGLIFEMLSRENIVPKPVIHLSSTSRLISTVDRICRKYSIQEIAVRITPGDALSPDLETEIDKMLTQLRFSPRQCHLIFDLKESNFSDVNGFSESIVSLLEAFPYLNKWKSFSLVGTSFPPSRSIKEGVSEWDRNEWKFYLEVLKRLAGVSYSREINYGDYSIVSPEYFEFNPKTMSSSANIKYTHDEKWIVVKGKALKDSSTYQQYRKLANDLYGSKYYMGEGYSEGDLHIAKCVREEITPGSPNVWIWVGSNHHFTKVVNDLFSILALS
ncbi:beta family protein [Chitinophaga barathri]|uniref:T4 beta protein n=1 Tax=Chitinophaga barathri TaxID=1647451 RepID=A0A3N4N402_9BACT|nr:beta family protein [Chitinophaga barathri]RPD42363.1 hypothetical protein EG028_04075 [Chitinophaga barathri]